MAIWLDDLIEQVTTSMALADSGTETGKRLAFIILDNAVEFLMKAYVESEAQLVGHGQGKVIKKEDWERKKESFYQVLDFVFTHFTITASKTDILSYHSVRNDLYHEGKPLSVSPKTISKYIEQIRTLLFDLHKFRLTEDEWSKKTHEISKMIAQKEASIRPLVKCSNQDDQIRFDTDYNLKDTEAILHAINAYSHYNGAGCTIEEIENVLARSSHGLEREVIVKRVNHLKSSHQILSSKIMLDPMAVRTLRNKFTIVFD